MDGDFSHLIDYVLHGAHATNIDLDVVEHLHDGLIQSVHACFSHSQIKPQVAVGQ